MGIGGYIYIGRNNKKLSDLQSEIVGVGGEEMREPDLGFK